MHSRYMCGTVDDVIFQIDKNFANFPIFTGPRTQSKMHWKIPGFDLHLKKMNIVHDYKCNEFFHRACLSSIIDT